MAETTERILLHRDNNPESNYHGPTMGYLISHNQLGHEIIRPYGDRATDGEILDSDKLARLRFVTLSSILPPLSLHLSSHYLDSVPKPKFLILSFRSFTISLHLFQHQKKDIATTFQTLQPNLS